MTRRLREIKPVWPAATTVLAWLLPVFAWASLAYPGYFELHSGFRTVFNLSDLARHLPALGWAPTIGQPYDLLRGEGALAYWLVLLLRPLGAEPVTAVKFVFGASLLLGAVGMYGWARRSLGDWPGLLAALVYSLWPVALATVTVRGALAEAIFFGWMPWVLWAASPADAERAGLELQSVLKQAGALALAFWTQAGLALWLAATVLVSILARRTGRDDFGHPTTRRLKSLVRTSSVLGWLAGVALGIIGLVPVILRHGLGSKTYVSFVDHFVYPYQLLLSGWGVGPSIAGPYDTLTFQVGLAACALAALGCLLWHDQAGSGYDRSAVDLRRSARLSLGITLVLVFLTTTLSAFLWRLLPFLAGTLTYPWQLLLLAAPWLAWLAGLGGRALLDLLPAGQREINSAPLFALLLALTLLGSLSYPNPTPVAGPVLAAPLAIFGDNEIALLDATTEGTAGPNATVAVHARWQALRPLERDYTVFLHVVGPDGQLQGQVDTMPQGNKLPTSQWQPGQVVADVYRVTLKPGEPSGGGYRYHLGLYQWQTGQRLPTAGDDKVVLTP